MEDPFSELLFEVLNEIPPRLRLNSVDATREFAQLASAQNSNHDSTYHDTLHMKGNGATSELPSFLSKETSSLRRKSVEEVCKLLEIDEDELRDDEAVSISPEDAAKLKSTDVSSVISIGDSGCFTTTIDVEAFPAISEAFDTECIASPTNIVPCENDKFSKTVISSKSVINTNVNVNSDECVSYSSLNTSSNFGISELLGGIQIDVHSSLHSEICCEHDLSSLQLGTELFDDNHCLESFNTAYHNDLDTVCLCTIEGSHSNDKPSILNQPDYVEDDSFDNDAKKCSDNTCVDIIKLLPGASKSNDKQPESDNLEQNVFKPHECDINESWKNCIGNIYMDSYSSFGNDKLDIQNLQDAFKIPKYDANVSDRNFHTSSSDNDSKNCVVTISGHSTSGNIVYDGRQESKILSENSVRNRKRERAVISGSNPKRKRKSKRKMKKLRKRKSGVNSKIMLENDKADDSGFLNGVAVSLLSRHPEETCFEKIMYRDDAIMLKQKRIASHLKQLNSDATPNGYNHNTNMMKEKIRDRTKENVQCGVSNKLRNNKTKTINMEHSSYRDCRNYVVEKILKNKDLDSSICTKINSEHKHRGRRKKSDTDQSAKDNISEPQRNKATYRKRPGSISSDEDSLPKHIESCKTKLVNTQSKSKLPSCPATESVQLSSKEGINNKHLYACAFEEDNFPSCSGTSFVTDELSNCSNSSNDKQHGNLTKSPRRHFTSSCEENSDGKPYVNILHEHLSRDKILRLLSILQKKKLH